jgi:hypothetical protein
MRLALTMAALACLTPASARDASHFAVASVAVPAHRDAPTGPTQPVPLSPASQPQRANFLGQVASNLVRSVADWVVASGDNDGLPFIIVDKIGAKVFVFDNVGQLRGATFALLGKARGDDTVPGIGSRKLSTITADERTTPAGRFVASLGHDFKSDVLWIDYGASISLHRVIKGDPGDHRLQRLATTSARDKRITYGCINVPVKFYEDVVVKTFTGTSSVVYILPEIEAIQDVSSLANVDVPDRQ